MSDNDHPQVHLPDPSIWPLAVGGATLIAGLALVWWSRDRSNDFAGVMMGAAAISVLAAAIGWATEDSRMRAKAARAEHGGRVEQIVQFAVLTGHPQAEKLMTAVDDLGAELRKHAEFEDLRIMQKPVAETDQVIVETTWSTEAARNEFDASNRTFLDLLVEYADAVQPGSVEVFDAQVVIGPRTSHRS